MPHSTLKAFLRRQAPQSTNRNLRAASAPYVQAYATQERDTYAATQQESLSSGDGESDTRVLQEELTKALNRVTVRETPIKAWNLLPA